MKISELRAILDEAEKEYGDIEVQVYNSEFGQYSWFETCKIITSNEPNETILGLDGCDYE